MTNCLYARVCYAGSLFLAGGAIAVATSPYWPASIIVGYSAWFLAWCGRREAAFDRRASIDEQRTELAARPAPPPPLAPCCLLWQLSNGAAHGTECDLGTDLLDGLARGWQELNTACCLRSWESRGDVHDDSVCTRKDQAA
ncbi:hypothetical protein [Streptomyces lasiicapitis]|uniref:hypothetical protein n=1 Tax=Streptomyces lasiicapitis TaxID=1923961 RepID=UPI00365E0E43